MIVKDEGAVIERCLQSVKPLLSSWLIVDTGSTDDTKAIARDLLADVPGAVVDRPWTSFGANLTEALALADQGDGWLLRLDADMTVDAHAGLRGWLATDPDPTVDAWNVHVQDQALAYRLPLLLRGGLDWRYVGDTHEWLDTQGRGTRSLLGLTIHHHGDGSNRETKLERDLILLADGAAAGEPRAVFYTAECLRFLDRIDEAADAYERRAAIVGGFEEERWFAAYQAAKLRADVPGLLAVWRQRPWRHEPLQAAADLVAAAGAQDDLLFLSPPGRAF